jgi:hypothetical protein
MGSGPDASYIMSHEWMMKFVEHRVADRRILCLI